MSLFSLFSCSSITFLSTNVIGTSFDFNDQFDQEAKVIVEKNFYMWGMYPDQQVVEIDQEFKQVGYSAISNLVIKEVKIKKKALWMLLTFGMYYPQTYELIAQTN